MNGGITMSEYWFNPPIRQERPARYESYRERWATPRKAGQTITWRGAVVWAMGLMATVAVLVAAS
jgi:hypothetical protein